MGSKIADEGDVRGSKDASQGYSKDRAADGNGGVLVGGF